MKVSGTPSEGVVYCSLVDVEEVGFLTTRRWHRPEFIYVVVCVLYCAVENEISETFFRRVEAGRTVRRNLLNYGGFVLAFRARFAHFERDSHRARGAQYCHLRRVLVWTMVDNDNRTLEK